MERTHPCCKSPHWNTWFSEVGLFEWVKTRRHKRMSRDYILVSLMLMENELHSFSLSTTKSNHWKACLIKPADVPMLEELQVENLYCSISFLIKYRATNIQHEYHYFFKTFLSHQQIHTASVLHTQERWKEKRKTHWGTVLCSKSRFPQGNAALIHHKSRENDHCFTPMILPVVLCKTTLLSLRDVTVGAKVKTKSILLTKSFINMIFEQDWSWNGFFKCEVKVW